jgi:signal peptidase II
MDAGRRRGGSIVVSTAAIVIVADRATKVWAEHAFATHPRDVIDGVLTLRFTTNAGGAFSMGDRAPLVFAVAALAVSAAIVATAFRARPTLHAVALGLILGGALGNLIDRATRGPGLSGRVVDFIDVHIWPVFNLADSAIVIGAILLAIQGFREGRVAPPEDSAGDDR